MPFVYLWIELNDSSLNFGIESELLQILDGRLLAELDLLRNVSGQVVTSVLGQLTNNAGSGNRPYNISKIALASTPMGKTGL